MTVYILMGVAGCGKSTIGLKASSRLNIPFLEGDDFHPRQNITKMRNGIALSDEDRMPWVEAMLIGCKGETPPMILSCSALSRRVRQSLRIGLEDQCHFIHLHGSHDTLKQRLSARKGHFFKAELLESQFSALEIPHRATALDIAQPIDSLAQQLCEIIQSENQA